MTKKILIIEDEEIVRMTLRETLETEGYAVREASDGRMGMDMHREQPADLIVTDIFMPGQEGLETIARLRREFPDVTVIAISGGGECGARSYLDNARDFGAAHVFEKPIDLRALVEVVGNCLDGKVVEAAGASSEPR